MNIKDFITIIINKSQAVQSIINSGTHWSLMLFDVKQESFYNFDSLNNMNFHFLEGGRSKKCFNSKCVMIVEFRIRVLLES